MRRIESYIVSNLPDSIVRKLRKFRELRDFFRGLLYYCFRMPASFYPYAAKYLLKKESSVNLDVDQAEQDWGEAFIEYRSSGVSSGNDFKLVWADTPKPGNFGDWLSPYIVSKFVDRPVSYVSSVKRPKFPHFVGLGSILGGVNENSHVIGSGISRFDEIIDVRSTFHSVRGPYSAQRVRELGGPKIEIFGDPGFLLPTLYKPNQRSINTINQVLLVRHINHLNYSISNFDGMREFPIWAARSQKIELFIDEIANSRLVVTSAMHCFITCISYGIPCILFKPKNDNVPVPGDGIKYRDALAGVGLPETDPVEVKIDKDFLSRCLDLQPYTKSIDDSALEPLKALYEELPNILSVDREIHLSSIRGER